MTISKKQPKFYSGYFQNLTSRDTGKSFKKRYSRFKKKSRCKSFEQIIDLSKEHLMAIEDVKDLKKVLSGLKVVQKEYPKRGIWKAVKKFFSRSYRDRENRKLEVLGNTISDYENRIKLFNAFFEGAQERDVLEEEITIRKGEVLNSNHIQWEGIRKLIEDPNFCEKAKGAVERMVGLGKLPVDETMELWKSEMAKVVKGYGNTMLDVSVQVATLFAGQEFVPELIRQIEELKRDEPGLIYPELIQKNLKSYVKTFKELATAVNIVIGKGQSEKVDLLDDQFKRGMRDHFSQEKIEGRLRPTLAKEAKVLLSRVANKRKNTSSEAALVKLTEGVKYLIRSNKDENKRQVQFNTEEPIVEALVVSLAKEKGDAFFSFAMLLKQCLNEVDYTQQDERVTLCVEKFVDAFKKYADLDLSEVLYSQSNRKKNALEIIDCLLRQEDEDRPKIDTDKPRNGFTQFVENCADKVINQEKSSKRENSLLPLLEYFVRTFNSTFDYKNDQNLLKNIFNEILKKDSDVFSQIVLSLARIQQLNSSLDRHFLNIVCDIVDESGGVDPRKISSIVSFISGNTADFIPVADSKEKKLRDNLSLFLEQNKWVSELDQNSSLSRNIKERDIVNARKINNLLTSKEFKEDVEQFWHDFMQAHSLLVPDLRRRFVGNRINALKIKYLTVFDPEITTGGADEMSLILYTVFVVNPLLGAKGIALLSLEDVDALGENIVDAADYAYFDFSIRGTFFEDESFILEGFREMKREEEQSIRSNENSEELS